MIASIAAALTGLVVAGMGAGAIDENNEVIELTGKKIAMDGPKKPAVGEAMTATIEFTKEGDDFGMVNVHCVIAEMTEKGPEAFCHGPITTDDGAIYLAGRNPMYGKFPRTHTIDVVDGTGKYANASGEAEIVNPDKMSTEMTIRLK